MRPKTQNAGASLERQAITAFIRRHKTNYFSNPDVQGCCAVILKYIDGRTKRDNARKGGLGK